MNTFPETGLTLSVLFVIFSMIMFVLPELMGVRCSIILPCGSKTENNKYINIK